MLEMSKGRVRGVLASAPALRLLLPLPLAPPLSLPHPTSTASAPSSSPSSSCKALVPRLGLVGWCQGSGAKAWAWPVVLRLGCQGREAENCAHGKNTCSIKLN